MNIRLLFLVSGFWLGLSAQPVSRLPVTLEHITFHEDQPSRQVWTGNGIPLSPGLVMDPDRLSIYDGETRVPADFQPLAWWPDGTIRWVLTRAIWHPEASYELRLEQDTTPTEDLHFLATKTGDGWVVKNRDHSTPATPRPAWCVACPGYEQSE